MAHASTLKRSRAMPPGKAKGKVSSPSKKASAETPTLSNGGNFFSQAANWDLEQDYEQRPRKKRKENKEPSRLPIKTAEGNLRPSHLPEIVEQDQSDSDAATEMSELEGNEPGRVQSESKPANKASIRQQIIEAKEELARIASLLNEDPEEHIGLFNSLSHVAASPNSTIKKLALATQLTVYKDLIPGYRIRPLSDQEGDAKLSKEVRRLRNFEQALVGGYQGYVGHLAQLSKPGKGKSSSDDSSLADVAISCACALLLAVPHFNFRGELLKILIDKLSGKTIDSNFIKCRDSIEKLFREDEDGTPSLDAVTLLTKMIKTKDFRVDQSVLDSFLHLRLLSEYSYKASHDKVDKDEGASRTKGKKIKQKREFRTKKQRKLEKENKEVEKEMREADATVSHEERDRMQGETLKLVFVTYFRILKARTPGLMGSVLEGLAKYAHLINQDFFADLLETLKDIISRTEALFDSLNDFTSEDGPNATTPIATASPTQARARNPKREVLLCTITAFALLQGQTARSAPSTLHLDLNAFISSLYRTLYPLSLDPELESHSTSTSTTTHNASFSSASSRSTPTTTPTTTAALLIRSLSATLLPPTTVRSAVPPVRLAAFTKQLLTASLQLPERSCAAMLALLNKVAHTHARRIAALWNTEERRGDGIFQPLRADVEASNPFAATVWEGELLRRHYCPKVRMGVQRLEDEVGKVK
ncbi:MAG: hypothetical protein M1825_002107 [Sarcosagium campestre]|nr:MAG: hypothetical protein M1825_002107 [Sarcosagium campestre]